MKVIGLRKLVLEALKREQSCFAVLKFWPSESEVDDWMLLCDSVRWLNHLESGQGRLIGDLREFGIGFVYFADEAEARRSFQESACKRLWLEVYTADGTLLQSGTPIQRRRRATGLKR
jgi:hypothetical protein